jgi:hypothetical protein
VDSGPLSAWLGAGEKDRRRADQEFDEGGIAQTDEGSAELMERSSKGIGREVFCEWVEQAQQRSLS